MFPHINNVNLLYSSAWLSSKNWRWTNGGLILGQRHRHSANVILTLIQRFMSARLLLPYLVNTELLYNIHITPAQRPRCWSNIV